MLPNSEDARPRRNDRYKLKASSVFLYLTKKTANYVNILGKHRIKKSVANLLLTLIFKGYKVSNIKHK